MFSFCLHSVFILSSSCFIALPFNFSVCFIFFNTAAPIPAFLFALDRNIETVDSFFNKRLADAQRRLKSLRGRYEDHFDFSPSSENASTASSVYSEDFDSDNASSNAPDGCGLDRGEMEEILGALLELRSMLRKLQWYGEVNRRGFVKILKKCVPPLLPPFFPLPLPG